MIYFDSNIAEVAGALAKVERSFRSKVAQRTIMDGVARGATRGKQIVQDRGRWEDRSKPDSTFSTVMPSVSGLTGIVRTKQPRPNLISSFRMSSLGGAGRRVSGAVPWATTRQYKKVFLIRSKFGGGLVPVRRVSKSKLKGVYGASAPRELVRDLEESDALLRDITGTMANRVYHHTNYLLRESGFS